MMGRLGLIYLEPERDIEVSVSQNSNLLEIYDPSIRITNFALFAIAL